MRANEYQTRAMSMRLPSCENATYMLFGLMAEVGEIADKIAKWRRKGVCRLDMDHLVFNTGDLQEVEGYKSELMKEVEDIESYVMINFKSYRAKSAFMLRFGFGPDDKVIPGEMFSDMVERVE